MELNPDCGIVVFTDGSCNSGDKTGGWAWVALDGYGNMEYHHGHINGTTINQMELKAPTEALLTLHQHFGKCNVAIYSDSEYVVLGCNIKTRSRKKNGKWWQRLDHAIGLHHYVEWNHVRGHATSFYNGLADKMAGEARKNGLNGARKR